MSGSWNSQILNLSKTFCESIYVVLKERQHKIFQRRCTPQRMEGSSSSSDEEEREPPQDAAASSSSSDEEDWTQAEYRFSLLTAVLAVVSSTEDFFDSTELLTENQSWIDPNIGVRDMLSQMQESPSLFKTLTNFTIGEFEELCLLVVPTIAMHSRHTGLVRKVGGRKCKLEPAQRLLSFILYMKHASAVALDSFGWNWLKSSLCDDALFIASCLNEAISNEIKWPSALERRELATLLQDFPGCVGIIDGTLVRIRRPKDASRQRIYFNGRKKMHSMNNTVIIDHSGLIIHLDLGYPGSMHDSSILKYSEIDMDWRQYFTHDPPHVEYLLGDPGYIGNDKYIMRRIGKKEIGAGADLPAIRAFKKVHAGCRVHVEWGIGGIKRKWRRLSTRFECTKQKFAVLFYAGALLTNFLHRRRRDYSIEIIAEGNNRVHGAWDGDF